MHLASLAAWLPCCQVLLCTAVAGVASLPFNATSLNILALGLPTSFSADCLRERGDKVVVAVPSPDRARERRGSDILGAAVEMTALAQQFAHRAFDQTQQSCEDHILNAICTPFFEKTALGN